MTTTEWDKTTHKHTHTISPNTKPNPSEHGPKRHRYALPTLPPLRFERQSSGPKQDSNNQIIRMIKSTKTWPN